MKRAQAIVDACRKLGAEGINQGTSGNISLRDGKDMLITPSGIPYDALASDMIVRMPLDKTITGPSENGLKPSSEWHFHHAILNARPEVNAVVHAHPVHATAVAIQRRPIPACHYMVAAFGGNDVPLAGYARFGSEELSQEVTQALRKRDGCLMANHGATTVGDSLSKAIWRMEELECLAQQFLLSQIGGAPILLTEPEIAEALEGFKTYGKQSG